MSDWKCDILTEPSNSQESYSPLLEQGYLLNIKKYTAILLVHSTNWKDISELEIPLARPPAILSIVKTTIAVGNRFF